MKVHRIGWKSFWTAATALLIVSRGLTASGITVVTLEGLADREGNGWGGGRAIPGYRDQTLHLASAFESVPADLQKITQMALRPDGERVTEPITATYEHIEISLSTTSKTTDYLSSMFADNVGDDETLVYSGPLTISTDASGPAGGPKDFDLVFPFQTPFMYDRTAGNLLMEIRFTNKSTGFSFDYEEIPYTRLTVWTDRGSGSQDGWAVAWQAVTQFTIVPEPSTLPLLATIALLGLLMRRKGR